MATRLNPRGPRAAWRWQLLRRFAALGADGQPLRHDDVDWNDAGSCGKIILMSYAYAHRFAEALRAGGEEPQEPYLCRRGHWHLRQIRQNRTQARRRQRS